MNSIGSAAGYCHKHQMDKMFVGLEDATEPTCVRCVADATPKMGRTQTVEDPGEGYFSKGEKTDAKVTLVDPTPGAKMATPVAKFGGATLEEIVSNAVLNLHTLPMPKDIKEFKKVQKVIKTLQSLVENQNG
jgi:hypothetical protein